MTDDEVVASVDFGPRTPKKSEKRSKTQLRTVLGLFSD